jgi:hypothetical protein
MTKGIQEKKPYFQIAVVPVGNGKYKIEERPSKQLKKDLEKAGEEVDVDVDSWYTLGYMHGLMHGEELGRLKALELLEE